MRKVLSFGLVIATLAAGGAETRAQAPPVPPRVVQDADAGWRFSRVDFPSAAMPAFDDTRWARVDLPHDWSADGPFSAEFGSGNGFAPGGVGWYRKHFTLPAALKDTVGAIEFDGIYDHSEVWVNGHLAGGRPYGYSSFECPLTPFVKFDGADNVIAVRVDHSRFADSRWYTGSGIYRHVRLRFTPPVHVGQWGVSVTTPTVTSSLAIVKVETTIENASPTKKWFHLTSDVVLRGTVVVSVNHGVDDEIPAGARKTVTQQIEVSRPERWSPDAPALYAVRQHLRTYNSSTGDPWTMAQAGLSSADETETTFGIRTIRFDPDNGFFLNDQPLKLKGVCVHHDAGSVGAAVPEAVWERRLRALKALGVNAIRTSHNPPAPEFLDLADRLGLLVKDEAFDEFTPAKNKWVAGWNAGVPSRFGYAESFAEWAVRDAQDMVRRDRNHPSIVMWSIGNEVDYPNDPFSHPVLGQSYRPANPPAENLVTLARPLIDVVRKTDPTRPVTMALASVAMSDAVGLGELLDVVGYNYQEPRYAADHAKYPKRVIFGSENSHAFDNWVVVRDNAYVAGQFLWTGIDYLGEARAFPNRANGAGLLDLAGFKKPAAWFRQSLWSAEPMVYLAAAPVPAEVGIPASRAPAPAEQWNWPAGSTVTVSAYTNTDEVTLALNGRPLGTKRRADAIGGVLTWSVPYAAGVLTATATRAGKPAAEFSLKTAGEARRIELVPDASATFADTRMTKQIEFRIVDDAGVIVRNGDAVVTFEIEGPARLLGAGNGNLNDVDSGKDLMHRTYQGRGLAVVRILDGGGAVTLKATSPGLTSATLAIGR